MKKPIKKPIRKAIIPAAGLGTRFLPFTKAIPKEMLPLVDTPTIQYIIKEAVDSGISEILIITNSNKSAMENHFDHSYELEEKLKEAGKEEELKQIKDIADMATIYYARQKENLGLGHAVYCARTFVEEEPFAVLLPDNMIECEHCGTGLQQLIDTYESVHTSVVGVQQMSKELLPRYGVVDLGNSWRQEETIHMLNGIVEKPQPGTEPGDYGIFGRYILTPEIFDVLEEMVIRQKTEGEKEIHLTKALVELMTTQMIYAKVMNGKRYDIGDKMGFLKANLEFAMRRPDMREELAAFMQELLDRNS